MVNACKAIAVICSAKRTLELAELVGLTGIGSGIGCSALGEIASDVSVVDGLAGAIALLMSYQDLNLDKQTDKQSLVLKAKFWKSLEI